MSAAASYLDIDTLCQSLVAMYKPGYCIVRIAGRPASATDHQPSPAQLARNSPVHYAHSETTISTDLGIRVRRPIDGKSLSTLSIG